MRPITDEQLLQLIDGVLPASEEEQVKKALQEDKSVKRRYDLLLEVDRHLQQTELVSPEYDFSDKVMKHLHDPKYKPSGVTLFGRRNMMAFVMILGGVMIGIYILATGSFDLTFFDNLVSEPLSIMDQSVDLKPLQNFLSGSMFFRLFLLFDLVMAILILDKAVLKPYFKKRNEIFSH